MNNKNEIYLKLTANVITDFLKNYSKENQEILFNESECSGYKSIRFSSKALDEEFKQISKNTGYFKNGRVICFEIKPESNYWTLYLNISKTDLTYEQYIKLNSLSHNVIMETEQVVTLYKEDLAGINENASVIVNNLFEFLEKKLNNTLTNALKEEQFVLNETKEIQYENDDFYIEGAMESVFNNKYERNQKARIKCIEHYGAKCQICGFDFGKVYGEAFKGKIEVHHKVPLYEIKKEYVVDPINDLIPVCSNCHMILHSKNGGTYTVEEVQQLIKKNKE